MSTIERKAAACSTVAVQHGLRASIPWASIITAILSMLGGCLPKGASAHDHITNPNWLETESMIVTARRNGAENRSEAKAIAHVLIEQGKLTTADEATALMQEVHGK